MNDKGVSMEDMVREAIDRRELVVYYQPQYDALTKKLKSAEALVRWILPDGTVRMPGAFIPELEKTDAVCMVDWYIAAEVCAFQKRLQDMGVCPKPISVNFSRWHIYEKDVAGRLAELADSCGVEHSLISVEITESALLADRTNMLDMLAGLRAEGFRISIDDFGSGLSSLSFVKDIQADELKIDKSLLSGNCENEKERIVLESIFLFANRLRMTTVAEGVETKEQLGFLRTCNCAKIQGFYFDRPMPEKDYRDRLASGYSSHAATEDILAIQPPASALQLLLDAVYMRYPLIIFVNLSRNSYYMMTYENFTSRGCPSTGNFDELIEHGAASMHPDDRQAFADTFHRENQLRLHDAGQREIHLVTRQMGDDGVYRKVETSNYFVKSPASNDVLVISLCDNVE